MGLPAKIQKQNTALIKSRRSEILQSDAVREKLNEKEIAIAEAGTVHPMKSMADSELVEKVRNAITYIARDVGIKTPPDQYEVTRFYDILRKYYADLSFAEVKMAFEMAALGELDEFLPKDKNGHPDKNHYQTFSMEYVTKILNAFKLRKGRVWSKATRLLPPPKKEITEQDRVKLRNEFIRVIYDLFDEYKQTGTMGQAVVWFIIVKELQEAGMIPGDIPEPSPKHIQRASILFETNRRVNKFQKMATLRQFNEGKINDTIQSRAEEVLMRELVQKAFDQLIDDGLDIRDFLETQTPENDI